MHICARVCGVQCNISYSLRLKYLILEIIYSNNTTQSRKRRIILMIPDNNYKNVSVLTTMFN